MKTRIYRLFLLSFTITLGLSAADCPQLLSEAAAACKAGNFSDALIKYEEAEKVALTPDQKLVALLAQFNILKEQKRQATAEELLKSALKTESFTEPHLRKILNKLAGQCLWDGRYEYALELLNAARNLQCPKSSNDFFDTFHYMAVIYQSRKKLPEAAIEVLDNVVKEHNVPHNLYTTHVILGKCYETLGNRVSALENYEKDRNFGKKVTYKADFSAADKAIERLSK